MYLSSRCYRDHCRLYGILKERDFEMNLMDSVIEGRTKVQTQT